MNFYNVSDLYRDMIKHKATQDKFRFSYNNIDFEVIFRIDCTPFELLFGVKEYNYCFILELYQGFKLQEISNEIFYKLCDILKLKARGTGFTSTNFIKYIRDNLPKKYSGKEIQPHEIAIYKRDNIPEADKIYFCGWKSFKNSERNARNFEKTKEWLGYTTYEFCKKNNISSCWTNQSKEMKKYYSPDEYLKSL